MGFNLEHSNRVFSLTNCAVLCQLTRRTWTECCLYMQNIHGLFFLFKAFLHYTQGGAGWKKKERLVQIRCTTTSQEMDTNSAMLCSICTTHPWDLDAEWFTEAKPASSFSCFTLRAAFQQISPQKTSATARNMMCNLTIMFLQKKWGEKKSAFWKIDLKYWSW